MTDMQDSSGLEHYEGPREPLDGTYHNQAGRKRPTIVAHDDLVGADAVMRSPVELDSPVDMSAFVLEQDVSDLEHDEAQTDEEIHDSAKEEEEHEANGKSKRRLRSKRNRSEGSVGPNRHNEALGRERRQPDVPLSPVTSIDQPSTHDVSPIRDPVSPPEAISLLAATESSSQKTHTEHSSISGPELVAEDQISRNLATFQNNDVPFDITAADRYIANPELDAYAEESRDVPTEIPSSATISSPTLAHDTVSTPFPGTISIDLAPTFQTSPVISPKTSRNSMSKSPFASSLRRRSSIRSLASVHANNTFSAPRDRMRYSWQSVQDDEPNRPRIHIIKLVSNTVTASAGFPQGEAFGFSISPGGRRIAAYNSARLYILQTAALPVGISQDYALKRRPVAVELTDEANTLAILADDHTINVYESDAQRLRRTRTITLDFPAVCIALAPSGGLLAAAYEGGVEIFSLDPDALPTDRRAVRATRVDRLTFSEDGSTLLGTTTRINVSSTVVISVPIFPTAANGIPTPHELKEAWCAELLHPENIRSSSHATFMREGHKTCNEQLFAWNGAADTFGILSVGDLQYGNVDFPVVISPPLSTCGGLGAAIHSCPAVDEHGDTIAMIVNDRTIRLYIVPRHIDDHTTPVEAHSIDHELDEGYGCPFSEVRWVYNATASGPSPHSSRKVKGRLIVTSPGGIIDPGASAEDSVEDIEGGRIILFDFDPQFSGQPGQTYSLTLGKSPPQHLEEAKIDVATQVALVRRRTVNQSKKGNLSSRPATLGRAATTFGRSPSQAPYDGSNQPSRLTIPNRTSMLSLGSMQSEAARSLPDLLEGQEPEQADPFLEEPYAQFGPRSHTTMQRAATNIQRHRFQTLEEHDRAAISVDNSSGNFLALPEYTAEPNAPLPSRFRAMAGLDPPTMFASENPSMPPLPEPPIGAAPMGPPTMLPDVGDEFDAEESFSALGLPTTIVPPALTVPYSAPLATQSATTPSVPSLWPAPDLSAPYSAVTQRSDSPSYSPAGNGTLDTLASLPRGLQRAYANAPVIHPAPALIGDWENVSPISTQRSLSRARSVREDYFEQHQHHAPGVHGSASSSPIGPAPGSSSGGPAASLAFRPPHHHHPARQPAAAAAAAPIPTSASLFPTTHSSDHVPLRTVAAKASSVAHPVMAWHPPAPSAGGETTPPPPSSSSAAQPRRSSSRALHSRHSSASARGAFAPTARAKRLGFFRKNTTKRPETAGAHLYPYSSSSAAASGGEEGRSASVADSLATAMETKSVMTWATKGDGGKCLVM